MCTSIWEKDNLGLSTYAFVLFQGGGQSLPSGHHFPTFLLTTPLDPGPSVPPQAHLPSIHFYPRTLSAAIDLKVCQCLQQGPSMASLSATLSSLFSGVFLVTSAWRFLAVHLCELGILPVSTLTSPLRSSCFTLRLDSN